MTEEKLSLELIQQKTLENNQTLTNEMERVGSEMNSVQTRLSFALSSLDNCREKQGQDEERINILTEKCSKLEDKLRDSINIPSDLENNIQIIPIKGDSSSSPRSAASSPCISKILLNSSSSSPLSSEASSPVAGGKRPLRRTSASDLTPVLFRQLESNIKEHSSLPTYPSQVKRSRSTNDKTQVFQLEQHCKNLEGELDHVKDEILKILSDKTNANKENKSLKRYAQAYNELRDENDQLKKELALIKLSSSSSSSSSSSNPSSSSTTTTPSPPKSPTNDRSSPDGQEFELSSTVSSTTGSTAGDFDEKFEALKDDNVKLGKKVNELESSLELMKNEFEKMEDYWQDKLDSERTFYEKQITDSDNNLKSLEVRMKEYEELLMTADNLGSKESDKDKLSTIDENCELGMPSHRIRRRVGRR